MLMRSSTIMPVFALVVIAAAIYFGASARLTGLDLLQLATDEYYFVRGVQFILEHGVPMFPTGGYYVHGPLAQYAAAASVLVFGESGFGYRLPGVLFSLGSIALLYIYSRTFLARIPAGLICAMLLVSSWHIEFARFIRMYSALQFLTLLFFVVFDKAYFQERWRWRYLPHAISVVAVLTHTLALLFIPFLFAPLAVAKIRARFAGRASRWMFGFITAGVSVVCVAFVRFNFRRLGISPPLPEGYNFPFQGMGALRLPDFPFWGVSADPFANLALFVAVCSLVVVGWVAWRRCGKEATGPDLLLLLLLVTAVFHQFILSLGLIAVLVFRYQLHRVHHRPRRYYALLLAAVAIGAFWVAYALLSTRWVVFVPLREPTLIKSLGRAFVGWPEIYQVIVVPWFRELPMLGLLAAAGMAYQIIYNLKQPPWRLLRNPAFIVCYMAVSLGVLNSLYTTTRYGFFVYPFILLSIALSATDALGRLSRARLVYGKSSLQTAAVLGCFGLFVATEDFNTSHLRDVANERIRFRTAEFRPRALTWYPRSDYQSPAAFVNAFTDRDPAARIIIVSEPPVSHYLRRPHAIYYEREGRRFYNVSRMRGTRDLWSDQRLLSTEQELRDYTIASRSVLLVQSAAAERQPFEIPAIWNGRLVSAEPVFKSVDNKLEVVLVRLAATQ